MSGKTLLTVSSSPHLLGCDTLRSRHVETMIGLLPALLTGIYFFGGQVALVILLCVASAVATEAVVNRLTGWQSHLEDLHAVLMGLMLGAVLPPGAPWWIAIIGGALTVALGKMLFGGLGKYPMNPVLIAWAALTISWPEHMNSFFDPQPMFGKVGEWVQAQTPLMAAKSDISVYMGGYESANLWLGKVPGAIGAGGTLALILGGVYLVFRRIVPWQIPVGVIASALGMGLFAAYTSPAIKELGLEGFAGYWGIVTFHFTTGGLVLAAFFLAPEPVSSPMTPWGMFLFGVGVGLMTIIVRFWGSHVDGAYYGVLVMSAATPLFDRIKQKVVGKVMYSA